MIFAALSNQNRLEIVRYLSNNGPTMVGDIADFHKLSQSATSQHLKILHDVGLLSKRRTQNTVYYTIYQGREHLVKMLLAIPEVLPE